MTMFDLSAVSLVYIKRIRIKRFIPQTKKGFIGYKMLIAKKINKFKRLSHKISPRADPEAYQKEEHDLLL